jgi:peptidoglycan/LPS O-acetylase OafA/YrhL
MAEHPYRAEIDGLRAIAVVSVVLFHADFALVPGGFIGVDIFFVISGFLITQILMRDIALGRFSLVGFYERRARRILPALFLVVGTTAPFSWALMLPTEREALAESWAALALFVSNLLFGAKLGYFSPDASERPLLHTWSLSVEEQFYVFFPLLLLLCWKLGRRVPFLVTAVLGLASLALAEYGSGRDPSLNFFFTGSRVWELMVGALAALAERRWGSRTAEWPALGGFALLALPLFLFQEDTPSPALLTAIPVVGTALVLFYCRAGTHLAQALSLRPVVFVGLISYSAYLWHQPLFATARIGLAADPAPWAMGLLTLATFGLAVLSWRYVETPFRRRPDPLLKRPALFAASFAGLALMFAAGLAGWMTKGAEQTWIANHPDQAPAYLLLTEARKGPNRAPTFGDCRFNLTEFGPDQDARIAGCAATLGPAFVILGDSHAIDVYTALATLVPDDRFILGATNTGCRLDSGRDGCPLHDFAAAVARQPAAYGHVLFLQSGAELMTRVNGAPGGRELFRMLPWDQPVPPYPLDTPEIGRIADYLRGIAAHVPVTWLAPRIEPQLPPAQIVRQGCDAGYDLRPGQRALFEALDAAIAAALQGGPVAYLPLSAMPFDMKTDFLNCDVTYWSDGDHWSAEGEARFGARLIAQPSLGLQ